MKWLLVHPPFYLALVVAGILGWEVFNDSSAALEHTEYAAIGLGIGLAARQLARRK